MGWWSTSTASRTCSAAAALQRTGWTTSPGSSWVSAQQPERTMALPPPQAVFGSPLILPGKFLDSPELPSKDFLEQFSKTLSAAEHSSTRHNTIATAAPARRPRLRTYGFHEAGRPRTAASTTLRWPLRHPSPLLASFHAAYRRKGGQGVHPPAQTLHRPHCTACAAQGQGPPARHHPLPGFSPSRERSGPQGTFRLAAANRTASGTFFPWPTARGFCTPCRNSRCRSARLQPPSADQIRPPSSRPGGALWRLRDDL
jgi:hypothetical protein